MLQTRVAPSVTCVVSKGAEEEDIEADTCLADPPPKQAAPQTHAAATAGVSCGPSNALHTVSGKSATKQNGHFGTAASWVLLGRQRHAAQVASALGAEPRAAPRPERRSPLTAPWPCRTAFSKAHLFENLEAALI